MDSYFCRYIRLASTRGVAKSPPPKKHTSSHHVWLWYLDQMKKMIKWRYVLIYSHDVNSATAFPHIPQVFPSEGGLSLRTTNGRAFAKAKGGILKDTLKSLFSLRRNNQIINSVRVFDGKCLVKLGVLLGLAKTSSAIPSASYSRSSRHGKFLRCLKIVVHNHGSLRLGKSWNKIRPF